MITRIGLFEIRRRFRLNPKSANGVGARFRIVLLLSLAIVSCVSVPTETPYNLGVAAYKRRNYSEAAKQWTKSVASGDIEAMNNLGYLIYNGYGVDKDTRRAIQLWRVAAEAESLKRNGTWALPMKRESVSRVAPRKRMRGTNARSKPRRTI